jgi:hypothetical protein
VSPPPRAKELRGHAARTPPARPARAQRGRRSSRRSSSGRRSSPRAYRQRAAVRPQLADAARGGGSCTTASERPGRAPHAAAGKVPEENDEDCRADEAGLDE